MNVLLLSMPDSFEHMPPVGIRMPNGALTSLAGNVDPHHRVAVADLILVQRQVRETVTRLVRELDPEVVGLSIMTFQRRTAARLIELVRVLRPGVKIVVGGYDPSLAPEAYGEMDVDYLVRSEGEVTFRELLRAIEQGPASTVSAAFPIARAEAGCKILIARHTGSRTARSGHRTGMRAFSRDIQCLGDKWM
ncbi:MAG TPA: cobalamin-dependent protein [Candidatus Sulfotelmatobacter sp.]